MEDWINSVWDRLEELSDEDFNIFFDEVEDISEDLATIIDARFSADKLHYFQDGNTTNSGGINTMFFVDNFEDIKNKVDNLL